jgi:hypothetical protein
MSWKLFITLFVLIALLTLSPIISIVVAGTIASLNGCELSEVGAQPCMIGGEDYGKLLYALSMMGWFAIATLPLGGAALLALVVIQAALKLIQHRRALARKA